MIAAEHSVYIVLATFNGERYLREQLDSIRTQTYSDWRLLIRDDGSTDRTMDIAAAAAAQDSRIELVDDAGQSQRGVAKNFAILAQAAYSAGAGLCFFADQDDLWFPHKLETLLRFFPESGFEQLPILAHSDMALIDGAGDAIAPSFSRFRKLTSEPALPLNQLLSMNYVTGCSMCINRRLMDLGMPLPDSAIMHDWWFALVAAATGSICFENQPLLAYRQHESNTIGASGEGAILRHPSNWADSWSQGNAGLVASFEQVSELIAGLGQRGQLSADVGDTLNRYLVLRDKRALGRVAEARSLRLRQDKTLLRLVLYMRLLTRFHS